MASTILKRFKPDPLKTEPLTREGLLWTFAAFLFASARVSESGISLDPSLYASVARNLSEDWTFFTLRGIGNLFADYHEQPFLIPWLQAIVFGVFGASDTTARLVGLALGSASFYYFFRWGVVLANIQFARLFTFLMLVSPQYTGSLPTLYMEVGMTFFLWGAFYYFARAVIQREPQDGLVAGAFLGCGFLSKGLAALPMFGTFSLWTLFDARLDLRRWRPFLWMAGVTAAIVLAFCALQASCGSSPFCKAYLFDTFVARTMNPSLERSWSAWNFFRKLFFYHPLHTTAALFFPFAVWRDRALRRVAWVGFAACALFLVANMLLGDPMRHYYHPIYPVVNVLSACTLYPLVQSFRVQWVQWAIRLGIAYQIFWHLVPFPMRHKPPVDFYLLRPYAKVLKAAGVKEFEAVGIDQGDWIYREMSYWYWQLNSRICPSVESAERGGMVIARSLSNARELAVRAGYSPCAESPKYLLFVRNEYADRCRNVYLDKDVFR